MLNDLLPTGVEKLVKVATDPEVSEMKRMEAKITLRYRGWGLVLSKRIKDSTTVLERQIEHTKDASALACLRKQIENIGHESETSNLQ